MGAHLQTAGLRVLQPQISLASQSHVRDLSRRGANPRGSLERKGDLNGILHELPPGTEGFDGLQLLPRTKPLNLPLLLTVGKKRSVRLSNQRLKSDTNNALKRRAPVHPFPN